MNPEILKDMDPKIDTSTNRIQRAMKVFNYTWGTGNWKDTNKFSSSRLEYRKAKVYGEDTEAWTNVNTLAYVKYKKNMVIDLYLFSSRDLNDDPESEYLLSMLNRFIKEKENEGYKIFSVSRGMEQEKYKLKFTQSTMMMMCHVEKFRNKWKFMLKVNTEIFMRDKKVRDYDLENGIDFCMLQDEYTIDRSWLSQLVIQHPYEEEYKLIDMKEEIPDLKMFDEIMTMNGWVDDIKFKEIKDVDAEDKASYKALLDAFGNVDLRSTVTSLMGLTDQKSKFLEYSRASQSDESIHSDEELMDQLNFKRDSSNIFHESRDAITELVRDMTFAKDKKHDYSEISPSKTSMIKFLDTILSEAVTMEMEVDRKLLKRMYNNIQYRTEEKNKEKMVKNLHNILLFNIMDSIPGLTHRMYYMMYLVMLKGNYSFLLMDPSTELNILPHSQQLQVMKSVKIIKRKEIEKEEELMSLMMS
jgi:hypothetical protein